MCWKGKWKLQNITVLKFKGLKYIEKEIPVKRAGRGILNQNIWNKKKRLNKGRNKIGNENVMPYVVNINDMDPITYHILKYCLNSLYKCKKYTPRYHTWNVIMYNLKLHVNC